ncbi:MAG: glycosyltransferase family A protein [Bacteroidota bacterium]
MNTELCISIIIPTYNREKCILELLQSLFKQDYKNYEIIIIDQSDQLSEEKKSFINAHENKFKYFHIDERGRSLAKNYGILQAKGDIILFCDDDIIPPYNFLSTHVKHYLNEKIGAVSCRLVEEGDKEVYVRIPLKTTFYGRLINKPYSTNSNFVTSLNGGNMSIRKAALDKSGFFEEYFEGTSMVEEPDIAYRVLMNGYKIYFDSSITVMHFPQVNGNLAYINTKRAEWFYYYYFNLLIFFIKYGRFKNLPFVFIYSILLSAKQVLKYKMPLNSYLKMQSGFFSGLKKGFRLYKEQKGKLYYTSCRHNKKTIVEISFTKTWKN